MCLFMEGFFAYYYEGVKEMKHELNSLEKIKQESPLIYHITNNVVKNDVANVTLAIGASPIMSDYPKEAEEITQLASALVLNTGTIHPNSAEAMLLAGKTANKKGIPVVLDPVGVGATSYRKEIIIKMLEEIEVTAIKGNAGEIATLADTAWKTKGVDAGEGDADLVESAKQLANKHHCLVGLSGEIDIVTDGKTTYQMKNGHPMMAQITGSGCMLSGVVGSFLAVSKDNPLEVLLQAFISFAVAGEKAANHSSVRGTGSFRSAFIDELYLLRDEDIKKNRKVEEI